jgi:hypothetical protein
MDRNDDNCGDGVSGDDPGTFVRAGAEIPLNGRQGDVGNGDIQRLHERCSHDASDDERTAQPVLGDISTHRLQSGLQRGRGDRLDLVVASADLIREQHPRH